MKLKELKVMITVKLDNLRECIYCRIIHPITFGWWRFRQWRRNRNPELVELDAFRELIRIDEKLKDYPRAIPLLEAALKACKTTKQEEKWFDYARRLRDTEPPMLPGFRLETDWPSPSPQPVIKPELYERALRLVFDSMRASPSTLQRGLGIGYNKAALILDRMQEEGFVSPPSRMGIREVFLKKSGDGASHGVI